MRALDLAVFSRLVKRYDISYAYDKTNEDGLASSRQHNGGNQEARSSSLSEPCVGRNQHAAITGDTVQVLLNGEAKIKTTPHQTLPAA